MSKDRPLHGTFEIAQPSRRSTRARFKRHRYRLAWQSKHLEYNRRRGGRRYRERIDLAAVIAISLVDDPGQRGAGLHVELKTGGASWDRCKLKLADDDFHNFLYWMLVSLTKHRQGTVQGLKQTSLLGLRRKSRQQKLEARQDLGHFAVDHEKFVNAVALFDAKREEGDAAPKAQFGSYAPQRVSVSIFSDDQQPEVVGDVEGEGGTIATFVRGRSNRLGVGAAGTALDANRIITELQGVSRGGAPRTEPCVVKVAPAWGGSGLSRQGRETLREGQVLAALGRHPNIIGLLDARISTTSALLILEKGLADLYARVVVHQTPVTPATLRAYTQDMLCGLAHMHDRRIYHLDVKPENMVVCAEPGRPHGRIKLIDFGRSRSRIFDKKPAIYAGDWTGCGTKRYIAPESEDQRPSEGIHLAKRDAFAVGMTILGTLLGPRYGWQEPAAQLGDETKETIVARAEFWLETLNSRQALDRLQQDGLHDISSMAAGLVQPVRDHRITVEDAYRVVAPTQPAPTSPRRSLL